MENNSAFLNPDSFPINDILPHLSLDCVVLGFHENALSVLLLRWKNANLWSLPGGYVLKNESIDTAANRILQQRTGLEELFLRQFRTFGEVERVNMHEYKESFTQFGFDAAILERLLARTISIGYYALVESSSVSPTLDAYSEEWKWCDVNALPDLVFDHKDIILSALNTLRQQLHFQPVGINLLPEKFTMPELQRLYETILGKELDRRNFLKRMNSLDILERLNERKMGGAHKAPYFYRFIKEKYEAMLQNSTTVF